jgi:hypothetical protein
MVIGISDVNATKERAYSSVEAHIGAYVIFGRILVAEIERC